MALSQEIKIHFKKEILEKFNILIKSIFEKFLENSKENQKLQNLRNYLLPKLMKGEIKIKN
jgi:type I restriction enzyme S subunit